jgi:hypothetical protein
MPPSEYKKSPTLSVEGSVRRHAECIRLKSALDGIDRSVPNIATRVKSGVTCVKRVRDNLLDFAIIAALVRSNNLVHPLLNAVAAVLQTCITLYHKLCNHNTTLQTMATQFEPTCGLAHQAVNNGASTNTTNIAEQIAQFFPTAQNEANSLLCEACDAFRMYLDIDVTVDDAP